MFGCRRRYSSCHPIEPLYEASRVSEVNNAAVLGTVPEQAGRKACPENRLGSLREQILEKRVSEKFLVRKVGGAIAFCVF